MVLGLAVAQAEAPEQPQFAAAKQKIDTESPLDFLRNVGKTEDEESGAGSGAAGGTRKPRTPPETGRKSGRPKKPASEAATGGGVRRPGQRGWGFGDGRRLPVR